MRFAKSLLISLILVFLTFSLSLGEIIRVPGDEADIRSGLASAGSGDTVLVADGVYTGVRNRSLEIGRRVTFMSENGPSECIIDGEEGDVFGYTLNDGSVISGFTLRRMNHEMVDTDGADDWVIANCVFTEFVGTMARSAVKVDGGDDGKIIYNIFRRNRGFRQEGDIYSHEGGAMRIVGSAQVEIESCLFSENRTDSLGGVVVISNRSEATFRNCIFRENFATYYGGAICAYGSGTEVEISFCDFTDNEAQAWGGALYKDDNADVTFHDNVLWGNRADWGNQMACEIDEDNPFIINHCVVEGGEDMEAGWIGDDLIEQRVRWESGRRPIWGPLNQYQNDDSPARNNGSGTAEELEMTNFTTSTDLEPDADRVDIGFHYSLDLYYKLGTLFGQVFNIENGNTMSGVDVITSLGQDARTNREGSWRISDAYADTIFDIWATFPGYNDSIVFDVELAEREQVEVNFSLFHPEFHISSNFLEASVDSGDTGFVDFTITNDGNGILEWDSKLELTDEYNIEPWELGNRYNVGPLVEDARIGGVTFADDMYYFSGGGNDTNKIYSMNKEGELGSSFQQAGTTVRFGASDLAFDGELIWAVEDDTVYGYTLDGDPVARTATPVSPLKYITWDPDRELLWLSHTTGYIYGVNRDSTWITQIRSNRLGFRVYGLAYWPEDPDGYPLYVLTRLGGNPAPLEGYIYRMNPETGDTLTAIRIDPPVGKASAGDITSAINPYTINFLMIGDDAANDWLDVYPIAGNSSWMMLDSSEGSIAPGSASDIQLSLFDNRFVNGTYEGVMTIYHNAVGSQEEIPISLRIGLSAPDIEPLPLNSFEILSTWPNPFNSRISVNYSIGSPVSVSMKVFDVTGREIADLTDAYHLAGRHSISIDATNWSSGVYFVRLKAGNVISWAKIACMK